MPRSIGDKDPPNNGPAIGLTSPGMVTKLRMGRSSLRGWLLIKQDEQLTGIIIAPPIPYERELPKSKIRRKCA